MNSMLALAARLPAYVASRRLVRPEMLPLNVVVSASYRCNSRCGTCNVWRTDNAAPFGHDDGHDEPDLSLDELDRIFASLGHAPYYLTFSGGEPFLRQDLVEIVASGYRHCQPGAITIPTNGLLPDRIPGAVESILRAAPRAQVIVNLSLDGLEQEHDRIRGVPGNWGRAMRTLEGLRTLKRYPNFVLGIHTVVSRFNVDRLPEIAAGLMALRPDSYITEVAEERVELGTMGAEITPSAEQYAVAARVLIEQVHAHRASGFARITQGFRAQYYGLASRILAERRQVIPCYAGWASAHIAPNGDVWTCCTRAERVGNLRAARYDFPTVWRSSRANELRGSIRRGECACPMANASYTNMLLDPPTLARVVWGAVGG
jgi:MoaA/NifB/PqqE/SkfB family radical SAM enzyme